MKIRPVGAKSFHAHNVNDNIYFIKWSAGAANTLSTFQVTQFQLPTYSKQHQFQALLAM